MSHVQTSSEGKRSKKNFPIPMESLGGVNTSGQNRNSRDRRTELCNFKVYYSLSILPSVFSLSKISHMGLQTFQELPKILKMKDVLQVFSVILIQILCFLLHTLHFALELQSKWFDRKICLYCGRGVVFPSGICQLDCTS